MGCSMPHSRTILLSFLTAAVLLASAAATVWHAVPHELLRKRAPLLLDALPPSPLETFVPMFDYEQQEFLKAHNELRRLVNTPPLFWSERLTAEAHAWAEARSGDCNYRLHSPSPFGENIFYMQYKEFTPAEIVQRWFNEYQFYDHTNYMCRCDPEVEGCECGHYLAAIWWNTKLVGCSGAVYCDEQKGVIVVCQYDPPGLDPNVNPFTGAPLISINT